MLVAQVDGSITPVTANYLADAVDRAEREHFDALLVEIDTPGGLGDAMDDIVQTFFGSQVPVIAYVTPAGGQAASAGAVITMAAHVAAMSPGTSIGAATPVMGGEGGAADEKVIQAFAANARAIAEERGRNVEFAMEMVTDGRAEPASVALEEDVIDLVAASRAELLDEAHGGTVSVAGEREVELNTERAATVAHEVTFVQRMQGFLANPNLAFLFMSIGTLAIIYELANPGAGLGGIIGIILVVLALFGLAVLPVTIVGVLLLLLAMGLFVAELFAPGVGVFAAGGVVSLLLSGLFLFRGEMGVDLVVVLPTALIVGVGVVLAGRLVWRARRRPSEMGEGTHVGKEIEVYQAEGTRGRAYVEGSYWRIRSTGEPLRPGQWARVVRTENIDLIVTPIDEPARPAAEGAGPDAPAEAASEESEAWTSRAEEDVDSKEDGS